MSKTLTKIVVTRVGASVSAIYDVQSLGEGVVRQRSSARAAIILASGGEPLVTAFYSDGSTTEVKDF